MFFMNLNAAIKFGVFALLCLILLPIQYLILLFHKGRGSYVIPSIWQKSVCAIFRVKIKTVGSPHTSTQTLYISNHISYLDIPVIGSVVRASFVAKKDVASWPVFGFLSTLQQTVFISRNRVDAKKGKDTLNNMLGDGKNLIIFAEGTSTDGQEVRPFKSSLFSIAFQEGLTGIQIQPITIKVTKANKKEIITQNDRDVYSWHINMNTPMGSHLWHFAQLNGAEINIIFHDPIKPSDAKDRKTLAKLCHNAVSNGLTDK